MIEYQALGVYCEFSDGDVQYVLIPELELDLFRGGWQQAAYLKVMTAIRDGTARALKHWQEIEPVLVNQLIGGQK